MSDLGVELELAVLYLIQTLGYSVFGRFEVETEAWRKTFKWLLLATLTLGLYTQIGHWALALPVGLAALGGTFHVFWCRKNGIDPLRAAPRKKYYELRGWDWTE